MDKSEALFLADELEAPLGTVIGAELYRRAAKELRHLHVSCEDYAQHKQRQDQRVLELKAQRDALLEVLRNVTVHLIAAHSLLHRGGKEAAASDAMFSMMLADYEKSFEVGRAAIKAVEETK